MYREAATGGKFWVSGTAPRWTDWRGRQAYRYLQAGKRSSATTRANSTTDFVTRQRAL